MERVGGIARLVCGRRTKWLVLAAWLVVAVLAVPLSGKLADIQNNDSAEWLPGSAEATQVIELQKRLQSTTSTAAVVVYERSSGITEADRAKAAADISSLGSVVEDAGQVIGPVVSADGEALQMIVPIQAGQDDFERVNNSIESIREVTGKGTDGLGIYVTGPAGVQADTNGAFAGIDARLLIATVLVVIILLLLTYRSPVLWLIPVMAAGITLTGSQAIIYLLAEPFGLTVNGQSVGILTVLVFGAGTDYALLLISRYREELRRHADRHEAMAVALRRAGPAILASGATVAVGMMCLVFAQMNSTSGLGPVASIGILVGLLAMLSLLPALLVIFGRWLFWPVKPTLGSSVSARTSIWDRLGRGIAKRPRAVWIGTSIALGIMALGMIQLQATGLPAEQWFVDKPESISGQEALGRHFPAGEGQPVVIIGNAGQAAQLHQAVTGTSGVVEVTEPAVSNGLAHFEGTLQAQADSEEGRETIKRLRDAVHDVKGADGKVGGAPALMLDLHTANNNDNRLVIPLVLLAVFVILTVLLRALVAPLLLIASVVLSFAATLGVTALIFEQMFGFKGADSAHPLFVFVFLVALGIDYNIFLMTRVREEAVQHGTRRGSLIALSATGGVITSAGLVMAATFAVFGSMPLVTFAQMGLAVSFGILLDTFIVRSVLVTALNRDLGRWMWWPNKLAAKPDPATPDHLDPATEDKKPLLIT